MQPRTDGLQHCHHFDLKLTPLVKVFGFVDPYGNAVHHFDIPTRHNELIIHAESEVEVEAFPPLLDSLPSKTWELLDQQVKSWDYWDMLMPSQFVCVTPLLEQLAQELDVKRRDDPLTVLHDLNSALYQLFSYMPQSTRVDSPIDEALESRQGVCQDFTHIMSALVRNYLRIPCRYVSGYLYHRKESDYEDRSAEDATHAWVEVWLPGLGWVGFDPTNDLIAAERHVRVAVGRDYADTPPTKGLFKGDAESSLSVAVRVIQLEELPSEDLASPVQWRLSTDAQYRAAVQHQQMQQQQQ